MADEDTKNTTRKRIDFDAEYSRLARQTCYTQAYTPTSISDAMYIDQYTLATIEYHCYQRDCRYTQLYPIPKEDAHYLEFPLATQTFPCEDDEDEDRHPMSMFGAAGVINYRDTSACILKRQRQRKRPIFMAPG